MVYFVWLTIRVVAMSPILHNDIIVTEYPDTIDACVFGLLCLDNNRDVGVFFVVFVCSFVFVVGLIVGLIFWCFCISTGFIFCKSSRYCESSSHTPILAFNTCYVVPLAQLS